MFRFNKNWFRFLPIVVFHIVFLLLVTRNFPIDKWFIGWDALSPELNFKLNFARALTPFWQENQGLGVLAGHGFAATLPHTIITYFMSLIVPTMYIRTVFTFLCLYLGGLGIFYLIRKILNGVALALKIEDRVSLVIEPICLISSLFYMLNLGTVQMFYIQLEAFIVHFSALPWLFLSIILLLQRADKKHLAFFIFVNFFASVQGFIPPLFIAYIFALSLFLGLRLVSSKFNIGETKKVLLIAALTLCINAYWLMPLGYYTITRSSVYLSSYNNLLSTPEFINKNKKYGDLADVALIKGFIFEAIDSNQGNNILYVFQPWVMHQSKISVLILGYMFFVVCIVGLIGSFFISKAYRIAVQMSSVFFFFFTGLTTNFFPFSVLTNILQNYAPIYRQAFRAAFTKFSLGVAFSYSIFFALGLFFICLLLFRFLRKKQVVWISLVFVLLSLVYYSWPAFQGYYLYKKLTLTIPTSYFGVIDYFKNEGNGRIADLPQDCPEGWFNYRWGYTGSGFFWYAIKQPILSRTFDVWSNYNENYYWELTEAIRTKNYKLVDDIFRKYDVKWIVYDKNILHCRHQKALWQNEDLLDYISKSANYSLEKTFTDKTVFPIYVYKINQSTANSFLSIIDTLPNIGPTYKWNDDDRAFTDNSTYQTDANKAYDYIYPFQTLFTKRSSIEDNFQISEKNKSIEFTSHLPKFNFPYYFALPNIFTTEKIIPVSIRIAQEKLIISYNMPIIKIDDQILIQDNQESSIILPKNTTTKSRIFVNGSELTNMSGSSFFNTNTANTITFVNDEGMLLYSWTSANDPIFLALVDRPITMIPIYAGANKISVNIPKTYFFSDQTESKISTIPLPKPCNELSPSNRNIVENLIENGQPFVRLTSKNSRQCITYNLDDISNNFSYLLRVRTRNIAGNKPSFYISNQRRIHYLDTYIASHATYNDFYYVLPPSYKNEIGYDIYFDSFSQNEDVTVNDFAGLDVEYVPYEFLKTLRFEREKMPNKQNNEVIPSALVKHPNDTQYIVNIDRHASNKYLYLAQAYSDEWVAFETSNTVAKIFPFLFGKRLEKHILINNWANGWELPASETPQTITIIFWPQYLEFFGFILLFVPFGIVFFYPKSKKNHTPFPHDTNTW